MKKLIPLTALALGLTGGVALADRGHDVGRAATVEHRSNASHGTTTVIRDHDNGNRGNWNHGNTVVVRDNHYGNRGWNGGNRVIVNDRYGHGYGRGYGYGYARRPIYVSRPIIRERYYNYYRRPALIVENYNAQPGYFWVAGAWTWGGAEWIWQPGHYQPDPNYVEQGGYDQGDSY
jgi:hypothetical protein